MALRASVFVLAVFFLPALSALSGCGTDGGRPGASPATDTTVEPSLPTPTPAQGSRAPMSAGCVRPAPGCACAAGSAPVPCDLTTGGDSASPGSACDLGQRVCSQGVWSVCTPVFQPARYVGTVTQCPGACSPDCHHVVDCLAPGDTLPAGSSGVATGTSLAPAPFCPAGSPPGGIAPACVTRGGGAYVRTSSPQPWLDACAVPGHGTLLAGVDDGTATTTLPFAFGYYGVPYATVGVSSNGMVSFGTPSSQWVNQPDPWASAPNTVFAFWDDLYQRSGICTAVFGTAPARQYVLEVSDAGFWSPSGPDQHLTFALVLSETVNTLDLLYHAMEGTSRSTGAHATIGIQQGTGSAWDQVAYDTPGVIADGTGIRWTPATGLTVCPAGVYTRIYDGDCTGTDPMDVPVWGQFNYTSVVPPGTAIRFEVRTADTLAGLASAPPVALPNAPPGTSSADTDLGQVLHAAGIALERRRYLQLAAYLDPTADGSIAPALGATEVQFTCTPNEYLTECHAGTPCNAGPCRVGTIACDGGISRCADLGAQRPGATCGIGLTCDANARCIPCAEGSLCDTGSACIVGRLSCATGVPQCLASTNLPSGAPCAVSPDTYTRGASPPPWREACGAPGFAVSLAGSDDGTATVSLPFSFRYYGSVFSQVGLSANGALGFPTVSPQWVNTPLPGGVTNAVYPLWSDLVQRTGVCTATYGTAPSRVFVAEWSDATFHGGGITHLTFEVQLAEADGSVAVLYQHLAADDPTDLRPTGSASTVGLQRDTGSSFDQVSYNTAGVVHPGTALVWTPSVTSACSSTGACLRCGTVEVCNGIDDTCNGLVDEAIPDQSCGVGACARTVPGCLRGTIPVCTPGSPSPEVCNGVDDNCNGTVDEGCAGTLACPADSTVPAGRPFAVALTGSASVTGYAWSVSAAPPGGASTAVWDPSPANALTELFTPYLVGDYTVTATAVDGTGRSLACSFHLTAVPTGLRVQLTWDGPGDLDLHLHNGARTPWFGPDDAYYGNAAPAWGAALDVDNTVGNGPETVHVDSPTLGVAYTLAVDDFARGAGRIATVQVFCDPTRTSPTAVFTSRPFTGNGTGNCSANDVWRVATVTFTSPSACTVTPIDTYVPGSTACVAP